MRKVSILSTHEFDKEFKRLSKKYPSLSTDIKDWVNKLKLQPEDGTSLGSGLFKVRLSVKSKGKGKSGGIRIIKHIDCIVSQLEYQIVLVFIYDKSEIGNVDLKVLRKMIEYFKK